MEQNIIHQTREGLNNKLITLCGAERKPFKRHAETCGSPRAKCNCRIDIPCPDCAAATHARQQRQVEAAVAVQRAQEERLEKLAEPEIFD